MEITKREIIISVAIAAVMLIVGFFISGKITDMQNDKNAEYQKAVHIEDSELFRYGMDTKFFKDYTIEQALDSCTHSVANEMFWALWIALTAGAVIGFCYFDNKWLED